MRTACGYAAYGPAQALAPFSFSRRDPGPRDVAIRILYCGICHSDIHMVRDDFGRSQFPLVPGHEIVGRVTDVGREVTTFKSGDTVGVGCMVNSCRECSECRAGLEQFCQRGVTLTYGSKDKCSGGITQGGYSNYIVVSEDFVLKIPATLRPGDAAPLLCAGITAYSALKHWNVGPGTRAGIIGLGGLGHLALKYANALGAHAVQFTTSSHKREDAMRMGAREVVLSNDEEQMQKQTESLDFLLDTVSASHDFNRWLNLLSRDGHMVLVGLPTDVPPTLPVPLILRRRSLSGSLIGGIAETQEMLDFSAEWGITADVEIIPIEKINEAFQRTIRGEVKYRFVIDMASLAN